MPAAVPPGATILTIAADPAVRAGLVACLEARGFRMLQAESGPLGLEAFHRERPDVVLCDLHLPGTDGLDLIARLVDESPQTPVVVVSAACRVSDAVRAIKQGAWDFLSAPLRDPRALEVAVRNALERADLVIENRRYRQELEALNRELSRALQGLRAAQEAGRTVQLALLPEDDWCAGEYAFTRRVYPSIGTGGDLVDYFAIDACHTGFYLADVAGQGAASVFAAVLVKALVDQYRQALPGEGDRTILQPEATLRRLDRDLRQQHLDTHLTVFYGVIDERSHSLACSGGGQYPFPILHDGERVASLAWASPPVGLLEACTFPRQELRLPERFLLLLASDGVLNVLPAGSLQDKHQALAGHLSGTAVTLEALTAALGLDGDQDLPDDVALLMVQRTVGHG